MHFTGPRPDGKAEKVRAAGPYQSGSVSESNRQRALFTPATGFEDPGPHQRCKRSQGRSFYEIAGAGPSVARNSMPPVATS